MKKILLLSALSIFMVIGCEQTDDDKISKAQKCLDLARVPADAATCSAIITGINSEKANRIRCALAVLENGTTQTEIINAFKAMDGGTEDPVIEVATVLGLGDVDASGTVDAADVAVAQNIKNICYTTESKGLRTVAELILFGTRAQVVADIAGDPEDPADVANNILLMSDQDAGEFGNDVFDLYCYPTYSNNDICTSLAAAGAGTADSATVGAALKSCLKTNTCN